MSAQTKRRLTRLLLSGLRRVHPVGRLGNNAWVASHAGVTDVLARPNDFSVVPIYAEKMRRTSGDFYLGMDDTAQYSRERGLTDQALHSMDLERYRQIARGCAEQAVESARGKGQMDVVQQLSWKVPLRLCEEFFGFTGVDRTLLSQWMRYIFQHLFLNLTDDAKVAARAEEMAVSMNRAVAQRIDERLAQDEAVLATREDFLSSLVRIARASEAASGNAHKDQLSRNYSGVVLGSVDTVSRAVIHALEELLDRPAQLKAAQLAARQGEREVVSQYAFEALRFNPHNPLVVRQTTRPVRLHSNGQGHGAEGTLLEPGRRVYALTYAAMFDPAHLPNPEQFRINRPDNSHLQFGSGLHRCFGERLARCAIEEILCPLLAGNPLRRAKGPGGAVVWDGPFPDHLVVTF